MKLILNVTVSCNFERLSCLIGLVESIEIAHKFVICVGRSILKLELLTAGYTLLYLTSEIA